MAGVASMMTRRCVRMSNELVKYDMRWYACGFGSPRVILMMCDSWVRKCCK